MALSNAQLRSIPIFSELTDEALAQLRAAFESVEIAVGTKLCQVGDHASEFYVLAKGRVTLSDGDRVNFDLSPPASIGELGALCGLVRSVDVTVVEPATVWRIGREALLTVLRSQPELGLHLYQNIMNVVAEKLGRDQLRLQDMRANLVETQRQMKALRSYLLESEDTPVSDRIHDALVGLIDHNRRINYRVSPPAPLPATVRVDGFSACPLLELSRTHFSFAGSAGRDLGNDRSVCGVLTLAGPEIPITGKILRIVGDRVTIEIGDLIDEYASILEGYLSRVQMVDFVV